MVKKRQARSRFVLALAVSVVVLGASGCGQKKPDGAQVRDSESSAPKFAAATGAVLPLEAGSAVIRQCTRVVPTGVTGFWRPSRVEVAPLEARLPAVVDSVLRLVYPGDTTRRSAGDYHRQYIGISRGPRRTIYVNAFQNDPVETGARAVGNPAPHPRDAALSDTFPWRTQPVDVCDGGTGSFGIEYDPQRRTFGRLEFNERLSGPVRY
jgi:hypothetical protein